MYALAAWMLFSKIVKLATHFVRFPVDILLWPISPIFGWFHGAIKYFALITLSEVCTPPNYSRSKLTNTFRLLGAAVQVLMFLTTKE